MTLKTTKLRDAIAFALVMGATAAFGTGVAFAQEEGEESAETLDTVVVTGTRIQSQTITASSPVTEIQREEFQFSGATRVDDLVNQYPQMSPYFDSFANNPSTGYATIDLRGLGPQRTLTLVNGNRLMPGSTIFTNGANPTDISIIPAALVSRVDILTGGASAVYGSDAVAGVVNFILDTEFEGVSLNAGYSAYQHKNDNEYIQGRQDARNFPYEDGNSGFDGVSKTIDIAIGSSFADGAGHAMAWLTWRENDALFQGQRDYASCALNAAGTACGGSATNAAGNFYIYQADPSFASGYHGESASLNPDGSWRDSYGAPYNYAPINYFQRPDERYTFGSSVKYDVNEHFRPYLETMFLNRKDSSQIAESGAFFTKIPGLLDCDTSFLGSLCADLGFDPALGGVGIYVAKRNVEGGPRIRVDETNSFRAVFGAEGAINESWSYNASFLYGSTRDISQGLNDFLSPRIVQGLLGCPAGSFTGCIPYNVWQPGGVTSAAAQALSGTSLYETSTTLTQLSAYLTGDLGFGLPSADGENIALVIGGETRRAEYDFNADSDSQAGNFAGAGGPALPLTGETKVTEFFMESQIPIVRDAGFLEAFNIDLGYRLSDYDLSGNADTYKIGFTADMGMVRARGGYNRAIRAPSTGELFATHQIGLFTGSDPCSGASPTFTQAQCLNLGVSAAQYGNIAANPAGQYNQFTGGNPDLDPEAADTYTLGFVIQPLDGLTFTVDYFDIAIEDTIATIGSPVILEFCGLTGDPFLCDRVQRSAQGDLWRGSNPATSGFVVNLTDNFGERNYRGLDLGATYRWESFGGRMSASVQGSYLLEDENVPLPGVNDTATYDCAGVINLFCQSPEWRHIANLRYARDWYTVNLRWRYYGSMDYVDNNGAPLTTDTLVAANGGIGAYNYFDLSGSAFIGELGELTVGINNVADKEPPLVGTTLALNANAPGGYDAVGRYFFTNFSVKF
jgi:outer membrane receptor protein involved in Fe transport